MSLFEPVLSSVTCLMGVCCVRWLQLRYFDSNCTYPPPCICPVHMSVLAEARTYTHVFGHIHIPDICTVQCIQCTVAKTHSELSGRCVGGASPLMFSERVFRGMGLKKGENGSNTRGSGCEPSRHQASPPLCSLESFVATGESQAVGTYKERVTLRSRRYTLKFVLRSLRSRRYTFKKFSARYARGGTP